MSKFLSFHHEGWLKVDLSDIVLVDVDTGKQRRGSEIPENQILELIKSGKLLVSLQNCSENAIDGYDELFDYELSEN